MAAAETPPTDRQYYLYVIELDPTACIKNRCFSRNGRPPVYVGQSVHPPEERFRLHRKGHKSARVVRKFGVRLLPQLYRTSAVLHTRADALSAEAALAERLKRMGYCVFGGH